jgi:hypothetical protein
MLMGIFKLCQNQKAILKVIPMGIAYKDNISCIFMVQYYFTNAFRNVFLTRQNVDLSEYEISSMPRSTQHIFLIYNKLKQQYSIFMIFPIL